MSEYRGGCHCGALGFTFATAKAAIDLPLHACQCSFCRRHGTRTTSDPAGEVVFTAADPAQLHRYQFGLRTASYLVCRTCGSYLGAVYTDADGERALVNVNCFEDGSAFTQAAKPISYDGEAEDARRARRKRNWTPARWV